MKIMKPIFILAISLLLCSCATTNKLNNKANGLLLNYGLIQSGASTETYEVDGFPGQYSVNAFLKFTKQTDRITLEKDIAFGIAWAITGLEIDEIEVTYSVSHPQFTLPDGSKNSMLVEKMKHEVTDGIASSIDGYLLNRDHELVEGEWIIKIQFEDTIIEKSFFIYK